MSSAIISAQIQRTNLNMMTVCYVFQPFSWENKITAKYLTTEDIVLERERHKQKLDENYTTMQKNFPSVCLKTCHW